MDPLQDSYSSAEDIPNGIAGLYEEVGDVFKIRDGVDFAALKQIFSTKQSTDASLKPKLDEFRDNNRTLMAERDALKSKLGQLESVYKGISPEHVKSIRAQIEATAEKEVREALEKGDLDSALKIKIGHKLADLNKQLDDISKARDNFKGKYEAVQSQHAQHVVGGLFDEQIDKQGYSLKPGAKTALKMIINNDWTTEDESLAPKLKRGDLVNDNGEALNPEQYVTEHLLKSHSYLFDQAKGGGSRGNDGAPINTNVSTISSRDPGAFGRNAENILKGKVRLDSDV